jgi:DNA-directed RNA polymerase subunit RPC12/RpoP
MIQKDTCHTQSEGTPSARSASVKTGCAKNVLPRIAPGPRARNIQRRVSDHFESVVLPDLGLKVSSVHGHAPIDLPRQIHNPHQDVSSRGDPLGRAAYVCTLCRTHQHMPDGSQERLHDERTIACRRCWRRRITMHGSKAAPVSNCSSPHPMICCNDGRCRNA